MLEPTTFSKKVSAFGPTERDTIILTPWRVEKMIAIHLHRLSMLKGVPICALAVTHRTDAWTRKAVTGSAVGI